MVTKISDIPGSRSCPVTDTYITWNPGYFKTPFQIEWQFMQSSSMSGWMGLVIGKWSPTGEGE